MNCVLVLLLLLLVVIAVVVHYTDGNNKQLCLQTSTVLVYLVQLCSAQKASFLLELLINIGQVWLKPITWHSANITVHKHGGVKINTSISP